MFLRIAYFARRNRRHLKSSEGIDQEQDRLRECTGGRPWSQGEGVWVQKEQACGDEDYHRDQLADGKTIADDRGLPDTDHVDRRQ